MSNNDGIVTSANDDRIYRSVFLSNGLQALLISDKNCEKSSAACNVQVGSMCDPTDAQGLAHFLEHMLFMGTEKYPEENGYSAYLSSHGGFSNAYTDQENTVYYFDVQPDFLEGALDMFASFFTCPLFSETSINREMNAVDSENSKNLQSDPWRKFQLLKSLARSDHPISMFSTGSLNTLSKIPESKGLNSRDVVIEFYKKYYSANLMTVSVYGKESLDQLEGWVREKFSAVPNFNLTRPTYESDPFRKDQLSKILNVVPIRDTKSLDLFFPFPPVEHHYLSKPARYVAHLMGHESGGSILSALKEKRWANGLGSYLYSSLSDFACFAVNVDLTEEGMDHIAEIITCIFSYVGMLRSEGIQEWVWTEMKETEDYNFRFVNKTEPSDYCVKLVNNMQLFPPPHWICGDSLLFKMDLLIPAQLLNYLTPENSIAFVSHKAFAGTTTKTEKWYGTAYNIREYNQSEKDVWNNALQDSTNTWRARLHLPQPNVFIPTDFSLKQPGADVAVSAPVIVEQIKQSKASEDDLFQSDEEMDASLLASNTAAPAIEAQKDVKMDESGKDEKEEDKDDGADDDDDNNEEEGKGNDPAPEVIVPIQSGKLLTTWHIQDQEWKVPKMNVKVILDSGCTSLTPLFVAFTDLFASILKEIMNEFSYYADCAGLSYDIQMSKGGLEIVFRGYNHKLHLLVEATMKEMKQLLDRGDRVSSANQDDETFSAIYHRILEKISRNYKNYLFWQPYYHSVVNSLHCLEDPRWSSAEKYNALQGTTINDFYSFLSIFRKNLKAEVLVHGNVIAEESKILTKMIIDNLKFAALSTAQEPIRRVVHLIPGIEYIYRQHSKLNNPNEVNSSIQNIYFVSTIATADMALLPTTNFSVASDSLSASQGNDNKRTFSGESFKELCLSNCLVAEAMVELLVHMV
eukprot:gene14143-18981_t